MTKRFLSILSAATLVAVLVPLSATIGASEVNCRIPFGFTVDRTTLPAGFYTVSTERGVTRISGHTGGAIVLTNSLDSREVTDAKLIFEKVGDRYTLREVWAGGHAGAQLPLSRAERDRRAANHAPVERVVISAM
jgi:hypothetical protein